MLRLAHTQVSTGGILINDIDDGLPNKTAKRGVGDKNKYQRDGNSLGGNDKSVATDVNNPKQKCYIPYWKILSNNPPTHSTTIRGYIDVAESDRVLISQDRGVIYGLSHKSPSPLITVTSFTPADVAAPTISGAVIAAGGAYTLTISGTNFTSLAPDLSSVLIGTTTLSAAAIAAAVGGTFSATSIVIPESLLPSGITIGTSTVSVTADNQTVTRAITVTNTAPTIATAVIGGGNLTLTGTGFRSILPNLTSVTTTGHVGTITAANIIAAGGSISDTSIVIPTATTTGYPAGLTTGDTVSVHANSLVTLTPATI
jgi:hypothetical protein